MSNGFQKFISGKGFYLALAVCLAGAGAAAWVAVDKTIENIEATPLNQTPQAQQEEIDTQPAEQKVDNVPQEDSSSASLADQLDETFQSETSDPEPEASSQTSSQQQPSSADAEPSSAQPASSETQQPSAEASTQPEEPSVSADFALSLPVSGAEITPFSGDMLDKTETLGDWRTHNGLDISAALGTSVLSACDGTVTDIRNDPMWGNVVEVSSGDYVLTYAGLGDDVLVEEQATVTAGQPIGSVGEIPCELSLEPHLHFDVKQNGEYVDPASLVE